MADRFTRRKFLLTSAAIGSPLLDGCTDLFDDEDTTETPTPDETHTPTQVAVPEILDYGAEPLANGTRLSVYL